MSDNNTLRALVIDDEPDICELLEITLGRMQITTDTASCVNQAKDWLARQHYDLCLTDMRLPDGSGLDLVDLIQDQYPRLPVAVITAHGSIDAAIESMKKGAFDFVSKPVDLTALRKLVNSAIQSSQLPAVSLPSDSPIVGRSTAIQTLVERMQKLARSQAPVYISGESGVGKELAARSIHAMGSRAQAAFVGVNCGAIPRELMESELFGHKKGSFTGAHQDQEGLFQQAEGGTLFLDEVAELPLDMQVKLLRAIQEKAVRPVGGQTEVATDVRILCATHRALDKEVEAGCFRQDLFYRLNVIQLPVPPLRERGEDIALLAEHILNRLARGAGLASPKLSRAALAALLDYPFPGNIRELENILERAYTLCDSQFIDVPDLQLPRVSGQATQASSPLPQQCANRPDLPMLDASCPSLDDYLQQVEKDILCRTLEESKWNKTQAARRLGISFRSLRYRLSKLGLDQD